MSSQLDVGRTYSQLPKFARVKVAIGIRIASHWLQSKEFFRVSCARKCPRARCLCMLLVEMWRKDFLASLAWYNAHVQSAFGSHWSSDGAKFVSNH